MDPIEIRFLKKEEMHLILPLASQLNPKIDVSILAERLEQMKKEPYQCLALFWEEKLVGACGVWENTRFYSGKQIEIDNVIIDEQYRSRQLGKKMMEWLYNHARSIGCTSVELNTYVSNPRSHKFYYNEGFIILGFHMQKKL